MWGATPHFYGAEWDDVVRQAFDYYKTDDLNKLQFIVIERPKERRFRKGLWRVAVTCPEHQAALVRAAQRSAIAQAEKIEREKRKEELLAAQEAERNAEVQRQWEEDQKLRKANYRPTPEPDTTDYDELARDWGFRDWQDFDDRHEGR